MFHEIDQRHIREEEKGKQKDYGSSFYNWKQ